MPAIDRDSLYNKAIKKVNLTQLDDTDWRDVRECKWLYNGYEIGKEQNSSFNDFEKFARQMTNDRTTSLKYLSQNWDSLWEGFDECPFNKITIALGPNYSPLKLIQEYTEQYNNTKKCDKRTGSNTTSKM